MKDADKSRLPHVKDFGHNAWLVNPKPARQNCGREDRIRYPVDLCVGLPVCSTESAPDQTADRKRPGRTAKRVVVS